MIKLRGYQDDLIQRTRAALAKNNKIIMQAPTGAGKTAIACYMIKSAVDKGHSCFFIVHQNELLQQTSESLWHNKLAHGLVVSGKKKTPHPVQVASLMTLKNRLHEYDEPRIIIIDESHRAIAPSYQEIINFWPNAVVVGLTATPQRTDGKGLNAIFKDIVKGPSIRFLIDQGYLCDYELFGMPQAVNLDNVKTTAGDYNKGDLEKESDKPKIIGDAVQHYKNIANGKRCVVMCVTVKHAESVARMYNEAGIPAEAIHGLSDDRDGVIDRLESGETLVVASVQLLIEGVDIPSISVIQWLRPTKSLVVWMQGNGRGLRPHEEKDHLIILDHVGNYSRHGLPDMEREWSIEGNKKQGRITEQEESLGVQTCEACFFTFKSGVDVCPHCGGKVERKERKIEVVDGELQRIEAAKQKADEMRERKQQQGKARELEDLVQVGKARKMRRPDAWAANVYASRQGRRANAQDYARAKAAL